MRSWTMTLRIIDASATVGLLLFLASAGFILFWGV